MTLTGVKRSLVLAVAKHLRLHKFLPRLTIEHARVGSDTTSYIKVFWRSK